MQYHSWSASTVEAFLILVTTIHYASAAVARSSLPNGGGIGMVELSRVIILPRGYDSAPRTFSTNSLSGVRDIGSAISSSSSHSTPSYLEGTSIIHSISSMPRRGHGSSSLFLPSVTSGVPVIVTASSQATSSDNWGSESKSNFDASPSSSSCMSSTTALHVTVLCVSTSYSTGGSTVPTTACSPSTTVTTTGCSVTGLTTTVSSPRSASATQVPCAPNTCGKACPTSGGLSGSMNVIATIEDCALISTSMTSALPTASYGVARSILVASPTPESLPASVTALSKKSSDATGYNGTLSRRSLAKRALPGVTPPYANYVQGLNVTSWVSQRGWTSGQWFPYPFMDIAATGVNGLFGCTAVIIVSEQGVYISHIWENPVFIIDDWIPTDDNWFTAHAFNALRDGTVDAVSVIALIGTDQNPGPLNAIYAPNVFVLTPFTTDFDRDVFGITTKLRYQTRAEQLAQNLAGILPGSGAAGYILGYTRTNVSESTKNSGIVGRAILEVDAFQTWLTTPYAPSDLGLQVGRWRLWVEDQLIGFQDFWVPHVTLAADTMQQRDIGYANPCSSHSSVFVSNASSSSNSASTRSYSPPPPASSSPTGIVGSIGSISTLLLTSSSSQSRTTSLPTGKSTTTSAAIKTAPAATTPTPSCSMQFADPDEGINKAECICDESITLPLISAATTAMVTQSCAYTALPAGSATSEIITVRSTLGPATTNSPLCQVC